MYKTLKVDSNLLHLQNVLFDLDNYSFDRDVLKLLNDLKSLVDRKMYLNSGVYGARNKHIILLYDYDNKKIKKRC